MAAPKKSGATTERGAAPPERDGAVWERFEATLGADAPQGLEVLNDTEINSLTESIATALSHHHSEVQRAERDLIHQIPRPLRGTVKRILR